MHPTNLSFTEILSDADRWTLLDDGSFIATVFCDDGNDEIYTFVETDLAEQHPAFPLMLKALLRWQFDVNQADHVSGLKVYQSFYLLKDGCYVFKNLQNQERCFLNIYNLGTDLDSESVAVDGDWFITGSSGIEERVTFVTDVRRATMRISKEDLNMQYPGWEERWKIGKDLGVDLAVLLKHVFSEPLPADANLDNVVFDGLSIGELK